MPVAEPLLPRRFSLFLQCNLRSGDRGRVQSFTRSGILRAGPLQLLEPISRVTANVVRVSPRRRGCGEKDVAMSPIGGNPSLAYESEYLIRRHLLLAPRRRGARRYAADDYQNGEKSFHAFSPPASILLLCSINIPAILRHNESRCITHAATNHDSPHPPLHNMIWTCLKTTESLKNPRTFLDAQ
jgi:hypothetical protein